VTDEDLNATVGKMSLHEPPPVDVLIVATSGRFTDAGVAWWESHNLQRKRPSLELWPDSRLEQLLAERPHIGAALGLS
jgi:hypothetical protein